MASVPLSDVLGTAGIELFAEEHDNIPSSSVMDILPMSENTVTDGIRIPSVDMHALNTLLPLEQTQAVM